jgi:hypothetical protein
MLASCNQSDSNTSAGKKDIVNCDTPMPDQDENAIGGHPHFAPGIIKIDSTDQQAFWTNVIIPILKEDKETVLLNMTFPIGGDWTEMMQLNKRPESATKDDFSYVYKKFFNQDFIKAISTQTYLDVDGYKNSDTTWFVISLNRSYGEYEGTLMLEYIKTGGKYSLTGVHGVGANFYDMN